MLWDSMISFLKSWFDYSGVEWNYLLAGIGLAIFFGAFWLVAIQPPVFKKPWLWAATIFSAFFAVLAVTFVQIPLQYYIGTGMSNAWSSQTIYDWLLLAGIPTILVSGLVQEGAKMVPVVFWWMQGGRKMRPRDGLIIGAMAGLGLGIFEAVWVHNQVFMYGWTFSSISADWVQALLPFWERFWVVAFHIGASALAGYGLAKGWGWQFYLLASVLHGILNYSAVLYQKALITENQLEIYAAVIGALVFLAVMWLRWRKDKEEPAMPAEATGPAEPDVPATTDV
jgi:RsiW-degrading membrane proteinase PrsW (M82 family)